jgi:hypothetical protein
MNEDGNADRGFRRLWTWATTPPQVYLLYVVALILIWAISFYAGTLNPRKSGAPGAPPISAPQR